MEITIRSNLTEFLFVGTDGRIRSRYCQKSIRCNGTVSNVLRERSIEAHYYDNDQAKVKCVTLDGIDFRIRLYRGRCPKYNHGIIVEVQRRFGSSLIFPDDTRAILDGAQGKIVSSPSPSSLTKKNVLPKITIEDIDDD